MRIELDTERLLHGLKTALACLIGFSITQMIQLNINQWIIITILVVMCAQASVGSVLQKSYMRFLGTVCGSLLAAITLLLFQANTLAIAITIVISAIIFSYLATGPSKFNEAGTLGAVTVVIILMGQNPSLLIALERFIEISIGILIAALVSQFILPIHARRHLRLNQANTIIKLKAFYLATLNINQSEKSIEHYHDLDEEIVTSLLKQRKLATEAARELFGKKRWLKYFKNILECEREILRSIVFMRSAYEAAPNRKKLFSYIYTLNEFHDTVLNALQHIADSLENVKIKKITIHLPSIKILKESINENLKNYSVEDAEYPHAYLFCAEMLIDYLKKLVELITEMRSRSN